LYAAIVRQRAGANQERINWILYKVRKDRIDVATGADMKDLNLPNVYSRGPNF
jgi:hypothetical protein